MERSEFWVLEGKTPRPATLEEWGAFFECPARFLWRYEQGGVRVVTAFIGFDEYLLENPDRTPRLFGTIIFGGAHDMRETRYETYDEALSGHQAAVELVAAETAS